MPSLPTAHRSRRRAKLFNWRPDIDPQRSFDKRIVVAHLHQGIYGIFRPAPVLSWEVLTATAWRAMYSSPLPEFLPPGTWRWYQALIYVTGVKETHHYGNADLVAMSATQFLAWRAAYQAGLIKQQTGLPANLLQLGQEDRRPLHTRPVTMTQDQFDQEIDHFFDPDPYAEVDANSVPVAVRHAGSSVCCA